MKSRLVLSATQLSHRTTRSSRTLLLAAFAVASALFLSSTNRAMAQAQGDAAIQPQASASIASEPAAAPAPAAPSLSAPVPTQEAKLDNPFADTRFLLMPAPDAQANALTAAPKANPHHGLAKTGAIVGTIVFAFGAGAFALAAGHCNTYNSGPCSAFHYGGIGAMAGGGALAATGFYFTFHK